MNRRSLALVFAAAALVSACDQLDLPELTLGAKDGIPPISGSTVIDVPQNFMCGDPIVDPNMKYTVTTSGTADACSFTFKQDVTALKASDYAGRPELEGARLVSRVDIDVNKLGVRDGATGETLTPIDLTGKAFGELILTKEDILKTPPFTKSIEGAPLDALKDAVAAKKDIIIPIVVVVVVNMAPTPPKQVALDFDAQPNIVFGF